MAAHLAAMITFYNDKDYYSKAGEINREREWKIYDGTDDGRGVMWSEDHEYEFYDGTKTGLLENMKKNGWEMEE